MIILRYLGREIYKTMLVTVSILLLILVTNQLVNLLNRAAMGKLPAFTVVQAVMLGIPQYLTYMVPLGLFLGIIVVLGKMAASQELLSMQASGFSSGQLLRTILIISMPVFLFVSALTFELSPLSTRLEKTVVKRAVIRATLDKVIPGQFQPLAGVDSTFHAERKVGDTLQDVLMVKPVKKGATNVLPAPIWDATHAKWAIQAEHPDGEYLVFHDGHKVIMQPGSRASEEFVFSEYGILTSVPDLTHHLSAGTLSTSELWKGIAHDKKYLAEWQWRFAIPISVLVFALISFPLSHVTPRDGKFMRVFPAVLIYAIYINLLFFSRSSLIDGKIPGYIGLWWVPLLTIIVVGCHGLFYYLKNKNIR